MTTYTATIPSENISKLINQIEKLNKKAVKLGCEQIDIHLGEKSYKKITNSSVEESSSYREYIDITVEGPTPTFSGWTFLGRIEHTNNGNIIAKYNFADGIEIPYEYHHTDEKLCEHCNTRRHRNNTYLVVHEDGEIKQVGSNCLKDFLGFNSPERVLALCTTISEYINTAETDADTHVGSTHIAPMYYVPEVLAYADSLIEREGFRSARHDDATGDIVHNALNNPLKFKTIMCVDQIEQRNYDKAHDVINWFTAEPIKEDDSEYIINLKVAFNEGYVSFRNINLVVSAVHIYNKEMDKLKENKNNKTSEHLGNVGDRIDFGQCEIIFLYTFENYYGTSMLIKFRDELGNNITWFSSKVRDVKKGDVYNLVGTVKKHDEYKGNKETHIKNAKLKEV